MNAFFFLRKIRRDENDFKYVQLHNIYAKHSYQESLDYGIMNISICLVYGIPQGIYFIQPNNVHLSGTSLLTKYVTSFIS